MNCITDIVAAKSENAIGLFVKNGRYDGTFAHKDIAFEFASAISPVFNKIISKILNWHNTDEKNSLTEKIRIEEGE